MKPFNPDAAGTVQIVISTSSQNVMVYPECGPIQVMVFNNSTDTIWISQGNSSVTATTTSGYPVGSKERVLLTLENPDRSPLYIAAITAAATGKIYFTPGRGETH